MGNGAFVRRGVVKKKHLVIGIDPGFTGAIAFLGKDDGLFIMDMPIVMIMGRKQVDATKLHKRLKLFRGSIDFAAIEDVHSRPHDGVVSAFRFGYSAGIILGVLKANDIEVLRMKPVVWKNALGLNADKANALALAKRTFPQYIGKFKRAKDDGRAEAALIAFSAKKAFV